MTRLDPASGLHHSAPAPPVVFLDTGMPFAQTEQYRRALTDMLGLTNIVVEKPGPRHPARTPAPDAGSAPARPCAAFTPPIAPARRPRDHPTSKEGARARQAEGET